MAVQVHSRSASLSLRSSSWSSDDAESVAGARRTDETAIEQRMLEREVLIQLQPSSIAHSRSTESSMRHVLQYENDGSGGGGGTRNVLTGESDRRARSPHERNGGTTPNERSSARES